MSVCFCDGKVTNKRAKSKAKRLFFSLSSREFTQQAIWPVLPWEDSSTPVGVLQYSHGSTGHLTWCVGSGNRRRRSLQPALLEHLEQFVEAWSHDNLRTAVASLALGTRVDIDGLELSATARLYLQGIDAIGFGQDAHD